MTSSYADIKDYGYFFLWKCLFGGHTQQYLGFIIALSTEITPGGLGVGDTWGNNSSWHTTRKMPYSMYLFL